MTANAQQLTKGTHHIVFKYVSILDWVQRDLLILERMDMHDNTADAMTKLLSKQSLL
jgi:hypothetical protein